MNPGTSKKGYGLFIPKSKVTSKSGLATKASSLFAADDDDDDDDDDADNDGNPSSSSAAKSKKTAVSTMFGSRKSEFEAKLKKQQEIEIEKVGIERYYISNVAEFFIRYDNLLLD